MASYRIVAYSESGPSSECPIDFPDLNAAVYAAELSLMHFGPSYMIEVWEEEEVVKTVKNTSN